MKVVVDNNNNKEATLKPQVGAAADPSPFVGNHTCTECGETVPLSYKWCDITYKVDGTPNLRFPCTLCHKMQNQDDSEMTKKALEFNRTRNARAQLASLQLSSSATSDHRSRNRSRSPEHRRRDTEVSVSPPRTIPLQSNRATEKPKFAF